MKSAEKEVIRLLLCFHNLVVKWLLWMLVNAPQFPVIIPRSAFLPLNVVNSQFRIKADEVVTQKRIAWMAFQQSCETETERNAVADPRNADDLRIMKADEVEALRCAFHLF